MMSSLNLPEQSVLGWGIRGWIEIAGSILETCEDGALKTYAMYKCNLNSKQITYYVAYLEKRKLLESKVDWPYKKRVIYKTTETGKKYVGAYKELEKIFK